MALGAAPAAAISTPERTKSRRESKFFLDTGFPTLLVLAPPQLHRFRVALNPSVFGIETQLAVHFPRDVGKLQHRNRDIADCDWSVEFLAVPDSSDEVCEVRVRHGIAANQIGGRSCAASRKFACLVAVEVIDLIAAAVDQHRAGGSHDGRTAISPVNLHSLATLALPRNHFVLILEAGYESVIKLPIVLELISST